ncbi:nitrogen fixation protein NifQ [Azospirillum rugosum]|uniref:Nitrogen fixation protein NifQ n=1 Tax=Azospirillum rugosum TaxID=416170 RepID=A0ABS4SNK6_9PROT|nr:nitrogen fixation protein NifQ [Azospirillum rugosum]MBP2294140.1 nitrogen fixation protein NifQ [Azospirillum rugosum]MDQ0527471.1 nitrogen fixation protein NifQ [Azospirillum rugosum]
MGILHSAPPGAGDTAALYRWLTDRQGRCNVFDGHLFACILARRWPGGVGALGLSDVAFTRLLERYFPGALQDGLPVVEASPAPLPAPLHAEFRELAELLLTHRSQGTDEEVWLAAMIARAALDGAELWQDLGLNGPRHLAAMIERHFHPLAVLNAAGTRWKTFLYRFLCARDGLIPCGAPLCRDCGAEAVCFGAGD